MGGGGDRVSFGAVLASGVVRSRAAAVANHCGRSRRQPALTPPPPSPACNPTPSQQQRILAVSYRVPEHVALSPACLDLLSRMFVANPKQRITIEGVRAHPWRVAR